MKALALCLVSLLTACAVATQAPAPHRNPLSSPDPVPGECENLAMDAPECCAIACDDIEEFHQKCAPKLGCATYDCPSQYIGDPAFEITACPAGDL